MNGSNTNVNLESLEIYHYLQKNLLAFKKTDEDDFEAFIREFHPENRRVKNFGEYIRSVFKTFDVNHDGYIDQDEFIRAYVLCCKFYSFTRCKMQNV